MRCENRGKLTTLLLRFQGFADLFELLGLQDTHDESENANNRDSAAEEESKEGASVIGEQFRPDERTEERIPDTAAGETGQRPSPLEHHSAHVGEEDEVQGRIQHEHENGEEDKVHVCDQLEQRELERKQVVDEAHDTAEQNRDRAHREDQMHLHGKEIGMRIAIPSEHRTAPRLGAGKHRGGVLSVVLHDVKKFKRFT